MSKKKRSIRVKLIANPGAGDAAKAALRIEQVVRYLMDEGLQVDLALVHPKAEAIPIARKAVKDGYDVVIAMGGDGTVGVVIRGIAGSKVRLGIIPAGTQNDIAASLGIPEDLKAACALIAAGPTRKLDLGQISTRKNKKFLFFMVAAIGLTATLYPDVNKVTEGKWGRMKDAVMTLLKYKPNPTVWLTLDDESKIEVETMLVTVANTPVSGAKNMVAPDASMEDGLLDIAVYPNFTKAELVSYFVKSTHEKTLPDGRIQRYRARKIELKTSPKLDVAAEGILLGKGSARIKVLPGALRVIAPKPGTGAEKPLEETAQELPEPLSPISQ